MLNENDCGVDVLPPGSQHDPSSSGFGGHVKQHSYCGSAEFGSDGKLHVANLL